MKYPQKYDSEQPIVIILDDLNEKTILEFKQGLYVLDILIYLFLMSDKITTNC